ncbi:Sec-independent protein translocase protein TatB [Ignatzschineria cameli]|uniref:Sec-independent protein translocase protein TatB n=1 Tax=Ignatzschineria cameli TaxID=2182793 RepID=UPI000D614AE0|nr:Sec-independent protein translocase protein TatB [Ignatzschineria cameli]PWD82911.1 twin-arginine translocase subunit TatB [Ignatzschineria cameli]
MFGISSTEFLIILVIALVVIGPQKLPEMIRTVGKWVGKIQHFTKSIKNDLTNELELDEIKRSIEELKQSSELQKLKSEIDSTKSELTQSLRKVESTVLDTQSQVENEVKKVDRYLDISEKPESVVKESGKKSVIKDDTIDDEEFFDLELDDAFLEGEAEFIADAAEGAVMTAPPKNYGQRLVASPSDELDSHALIARIVRMRQAEIAAQENDKVALQFALMEAKEARNLLSQDEIRRRMTLRQLELNR